MKTIIDCFVVNPAGTQSSCNVEIWSKLQRWKLVAISILNQRWNTVDTSTLTVVEKWLSVWCVHDFEIMSVSCLFPSPHSIYWIIIHAYAAKSTTSFTMNRCNHTSMRTLSLVEKFWTRSLLLDTYIMPKVCDCMYRWCGASQNSICGYTKCIWATAGMLYRELIILWMDLGQIW